MNKDQIEFLLDAGYSMEEIIGRFSAPAPAPTAAPEPAPAPTPAPEPAPAPAPDPLPSSMAAIERTMNEIAAMLRTGALAAQFGPPQPDRSVTDILAEVINPPRKNKEK